MHWIESVWVSIMANLGLVNCPTRWSLLFIFVFLCWSSQIQRNIVQRCDNLGPTSVVLLSAPNWVQSSLLLIYCAVKFEVICSVLVAGDQLVSTTTLFSINQFQKIPCNVKFAGSRIGAVKVTSRAGLVSVEAGSIAGDYLVSTTKYHQVKFQWKPWKHYQAIN